MSRPAPVEDSPELAWQRAREILLLRLGREAFHAGVESLRFAGMEGDELRLIAPTTAAANWMALHHPGGIEDAIRAAGKAYRVSVIVAGRAAQGELFPGESPTGKRRPIRFGALVPRYTFATFVVGASNQFANAACKAVAAQPDTTTTPLPLRWGWARETHLANAIGHATLEGTLRQRRLSQRRSLHDPTHHGASSRSDGQFKSTFRKIDVLIIDDVQFLANRERTQESSSTPSTPFTRLTIRSSSHPTRSPKDIPGLEERLRNRFEWGLIAICSRPTWRRASPSWRRRRKSTA
jgi:chromosomal replication initiator protein